MFSRFKKVLIIVALSIISTFTYADTIGEVNTTFRAIGSNDKIVVESFDDPHIPQITCYLSRAKTGGITGTVGIAEDSSDASIMCIKTSNISSKLSKDVTEKGVEVFKKSTSIMLKTMQVIRFYHKNKNTVVYLVYSDKLIEGSPKNSITVVPLN